jgi:hypothetical protein
MRIEKCTENHRGLNAIHTSLVLSALLVFAGGLAGCRVTGGKAAPSEAVSEVLIGTVYGPTEGKESRDVIRVSPDGGHVMFRVVNDERKTCVSVDGRVWKPYDNAKLELARFSSSGKTFAFPAIESGSSHLSVVINDQETIPDHSNIIPPQGDDFITGFWLSPDGRRYAWIAHLGLKLWSTRENENGIFCSGSNQVVFVNGKPGKVYGGVYDSGVVFSPDSKRVAYLALLGGEAFVVCDGREGKHYSESMACGQVFSPNSKHLAYVVGNSNEQFVVMDNKEFKKYDGIQADSLCFSPDSHHLAFIARAGERKCLVLDGHETFLDKPTGLLFSPDSRHLALMVHKDDQWFVSLDGNLGTPFDGIGKLQFSPDSRRLAYMAMRGGKWFVVIGDVVEGPYDSLGATCFHFSPDSKHTAYAAKYSDGWCIVLDGRALKRYEDTSEGAPWFSPDSQHLAYGAITGKETRLVVDEREGPVHNKILDFHYGPGAVFDSNKRLHYFAINGTNLYRVSMPITTSGLPK